LFNLIDDNQGQFSFRCHTSCAAFERSVPSVQGTRTDAACFGSSMVTSKRLE
jgi:hypothetical protein